MLGIVTIHVLYQWGDQTSSLNATGILQLLLFQTVKFASIAFFLISGFLLGGRLERSAPWSYFKRRWNKIGMPWFFWALLFSVYSLLRYDLAHLSLAGAIQYRMFDTLLLSIYWFVPNALFSLGVLLLFRRHLDKTWFGAVLFSISLFYAVNPYFGWVSGAHTAAVGAYVFYLWLGNQAHRHHGKVVELLERVPFWSLCSGILILGTLGMLESLILIEMHSNVTETTVRISNQLFSVLVALLLMKTKPSWPKITNPRNETFGIYLIHPFTLLIGKAIVTAAHFNVFHTLLADDKQIWEHPGYAFCYWIAEFLLTYGLALAATKALIACRLGNLVGAAPQEKTAIQTRPVPMQTPLPA